MGSPQPARETGTLVSASLTQDWGPILKATWEGCGMGAYLDLLESVTLSSTPPKACRESRGQVRGCRAGLGMGGWVKLLGAGLAVGGRCWVEPWGAGLGRGRLGRALGSRVVRPGLGLAGEHTFGPKHGGVAGVVAIGLAFVLQRKGPLESVPAKRHTPAAPEAPLTSAWPPEVSVFPHFSHFRQGRCQSFPRDVTRSAAEIQTGPP